MSEADGVRRAAIAWYARLCSGEASAADEAAWSAWHAADPEHRRAWDKLERLRATLGSVPPQLGVPVLNGVAAPGRRRMLRIAGLAVGVGGAAWLAREQGATLLADHRTGPGQRLALVLDDGSRLLLNTRSAVDVRFDAGQRLLRLHAGEILLESAAMHGHRDPRPLIVATEHGTVQALGTRFTLRLLEERTAVNVLEHAVRLQPARSGETMVLQAGEQAMLSAGAVERSAAPNPDASAWLDGHLVVDDAPLGEVVAELARYRPGRLACDPAVARLRVSGAFPLDDTDRALAALSRSLPVRVRFATRWWVTVTPA